MIKPSSKIKRGTLFIIKDTGEEVKFDIITHDGLHMVTYPNGSWATFEPDELKPVTKGKTPVNKVSDGKKEDDKVYKTLRNLFLSNHPVCEAKILGCLKKSTEVHHKKGRVGKNYLDVHTFLALCNNCHRWIEIHPEWAKENGYSLDRL